LHVVVFILAGLLILFGGGCTLTFLALLIYDPSSFFSDTAMILSVWLFLGVVPLAAGIVLWRVAPGMNRKNTAPAPTDKGETP
jgi:hypothetical protein